MGAGLLNRRAVVQGFASLTAAAAVRARAAELAPVRVALLPTDSATEIYAAQSQGYFTRAGLACKISVMPNGAVISAGLLSGSIDVGEVNLLSLVSAHQKKFPLKIVAPGALCSTAMPLGAMLVLNDSTIKSVRDLDGKTIAVNSLKGIGEIATVNWMDKSGGDSKSGHFIEMPFSVMAAALRAHRVDAALLQEPTLSETTVQGGVRDIGSAYGSISSRWMITAWAATEAWIAANSDTARRYAEALRGSSAWSNKNRDKTAQIVSDLMKVDIGVARSMHRYDFAEKPDVSLVAPVIDVAARYGVITSRFPAADLFSPTESL